MSFILGTESRTQLGPSTLGFETANISWPSSNPPAPGDQGAGSYNQMSAESSLQKTAVWACVNLTATIAEILPGDVYSGDDKRPRPFPAWLNDLGGEGYQLGDWCHQFVYSGMLRGNEFSIVDASERDPRTGKPRMLPLSHPDDVTGRYVNGRIVWRIGQVEYDQAEVWHKRQNPVPGSVLGLSPIRSAASTIGTGIAATEFGLRWFTDGAHPTAILSSDQELTQDKANTVKTRFLAALARRREPVVLGQGWKYDQLQIAPNESQFLETNQWTSAECCRIFGPAYAEIFGYETGGSLTYTNIEQRSLDLLTYAVDRWLVRIERALSELLPAPQYFKFNRGALLRTDLLTRYRAHEIALRNDWQVINEVRALEDETPVPWGDEPMPKTAPAAVPAPADDPTKDGA